MADMKNRRSAVIASSDEKSYTAVRNVLRGTFESLRHVSSMARAVEVLSREKTDLLVINTPLPDDFGLQGALQLVRQSRTAVLLIVRQELFERVCYQTEGSGIYVLTRPLNGQMLVEACRVLAVSQEKVSLLADENRRLKRRLEDLGIIHRAKCLLIEKRGMREDEAHHYLEKAAMDESVSKKDAAREIIEMLQDDP